MASTVGKRVFRTDYFGCPNFSFKPFFVFLKKCFIFYSKLLLFEITVTEILTDLLHDVWFIKCSANKSKQLMWSSVYPVHAVHCIYCQYKHTHTPQYHRAALSSSGGCSTAHPSPLGKDPRELKHMMGKTQRTLTLICTQLNFHRMLFSKKNQICQITYQVTELQNEKNKSEPWNQSSINKEIKKISLKIHQPRTVKWKRLLLLLLLLLYLIQLQQQVSGVCVLVLINWR